MQLDPRSSRRKLTISLTPLIDVVFILLLFFMLTSSFTPWRVLQTNLPTTSSRASDEENNVKILILKSNDNLFWYDDEPHSFTDSRLIEELLTQNADTAFALKADEGVTLQTLISAADHLKMKGADSISIANALGSPTPSTGGEQ